jgi:type IV pilus assembly protein PilO
MKLSNREQVLLGVLLIVLLGFGFYKFIYIKQNLRIAELKSSRDNYLKKWEQVKATITSKDETNEQYKALNAKIVSKTDMLFPQIKQEEIIVILDRMLEDSKLQGEVLGFSKVSIDSATEDTSKTEENNVINELDKLVKEFNSSSTKDSSSEETNNSKVEPNKINTNKDSEKADNSKVVGPYKMQVTLNFRGVYDELISFIGQVENYDKKIIINNINLVGAEGRDVSGTIILEFYGVPKLNDNDYFAWDYKEPSGNENPFLGSSSSVQSNNEMITNSEVKDDNEIIINKAENETKGDFVMTAKPVTSDLHTVTIEKAKDETKQSYIYSDNEEIELVEFYITKTGSKYFYKYKTSIETYPKNFNSFIEFIPNGENIILDIFSQKRGLRSDLSGADIKITNDTDKNVVVNILDDDKNKPRVKIIEEIGDISVIRSYDYYTDK